MWTSPEVILDLPWNTATDIWSLGAMIYTCLLHSSLFIPFSFSGIVVSMPSKEKVQTKYTLTQNPHTGQIKILLFGNDFNIFCPDPPR